MIKTIVFDLGGVYFCSGTKVIFRHLNKLKFLPEDRKRKIDYIFTGKEKALYGMGKLTRRQFWKAIAKKLQLSKNQLLRLEKIWHSSYKPNRGMRTLVRRLRKNYRVIVFSGNIKERVEYLHKKYGLLNEFDDFVFSFDFGTNKKEKKFYKILLKKIKCKPEECVCVDNSSQVLEMEKSLGMHTILFKNAKQLKTDLRKFNIKI